MIAFRIIFSYGADRDYVSKVFLTKIDKNEMQTAIALTKMANRECGFLKSGSFFRTH